MNNKRKNCGYFIAFLVNIIITILLATAAYVNGRSWSDKTVLLISLTTSCLITIIWLQAIYAEKFTGLKPLGVLADCSYIAALLYMLMLMLCLGLVLEMRGLRTRNFKQKTSVVTEVFIVANILPIRRVNL